MKIRMCMCEALEGVDVLPAILEILPEGLTAWAANGDAIVYDNGVEIARVPIAGLSPRDAVRAVRKALKGVI